MQKVYLITGSTSGIGKALLEEYSKENLVLAGYRDESKKIEGENIIPFYIDFAKPETIQPAIEKIKKHYTVDTIINCAGCVVAGPIQNISIDELHRQFDVNVFAPLEFSKGILPNKVINISSMSSFGIYPFIAPYCASKRCLDILFNLWGLESGITGVKVVSLKLGSVATPIWSKSIKENQQVLEISKDKYKKETDYLVKNALKNETKGIPVQEVVDKVVKIDKLKNPKPSYTFGLDAKITEIFSHFPQGFINFVIKNKLNNMK